MDACESHATADEAEADAEVHLPEPTPRYVIATYGTRDGRHVRTEDPQRYATRELAQDEIDERAAGGDEAAVRGRMKVEAAGE